MNMVPGPPINIIYYGDRSFTVAPLFQLSLSEKSIIQVPDTGMSQYL